MIERRCKKKAMIAELADESVCPSLLLKTLETCDAGAFDCQPIFTASERPVAVFRGFFAVTSSRWVDGPVPIVDSAHHFAKPARELGGS